MLRPRLAFSIRGLDAGVSDIMLPTGQLLTAAFVALAQLNGPEGKKTVVDTDFFPEMGRAGFWNSELEREALNF